MRFVRPKEEQSITITVEQAGETDEQQADEEEISSPANLNSLRQNISQSFSTFKAIQPWLPMILSKCEISSCKAQVLSCADKVLSTRPDPTEERHFHFPPFVNAISSISIMCRSFARFGKSHAPKQTFTAAIFSGRNRSSLPPRPCGVVPQ